MDRRLTGEDADDRTGGPAHRVCLSAATEGGSCKTDDTWMCMDERKHRWLVPCADEPEVSCADDTD